MTSSQSEHLMPFGTQLVVSRGVSFRLWAPSVGAVDLCLEEGGQKSFHPMIFQTDGWFEVTVFPAGPGSLYRFRIGKTPSGEDLLVPDPASRQQWVDAEGPSVVVDPTAFNWNEGGYAGRDWEEAVLYEIHTGTFTPQGTFDGIRERLPYLAELGITAITLMPIADFPGRYNWGYDGVLPFAPDTRYGSPESLKQLVAAAHRLNIMVLLDVVYNHFGPEGNYLSLYAGGAFFSRDRQTPWGSAIRFSGLHGRTVRDFFIHNLLYWLEEYRLDGLRLDAVHELLDDTSPDILQEMSRRARQGPGHRRSVHLILENDANQARYLSRNRQGRPDYYTAQWNDDFHHAVHLLLTGEETGCYRDYAGDPLAHLGRCLTEGFSFQGEPSPFRQHRPRGEPSRHLPPTAFVTFLQNHDQVGNRPYGERLSQLISPQVLRIATALLLLSPMPPLLFMGEEFGCTTPFLFFCDFHSKLARQVRKSRHQEAVAFYREMGVSPPEPLPDPTFEGSFERSRLAWSDQQTTEGSALHQLYQTLLTIRHHHLIPRLKGQAGDASQEGAFKGGAKEKEKAVWQPVGAKGLQVTWPCPTGERLRLVVNFAPQPAPWPVTPIAIPKETILYSDPPLASESFSSDRVAGHSILCWLEGSGTETAMVGRRPEND